MLVYGDRANFLQHVIPRITHQGVGQIVIVANAVSTRTYTLIQSLKSRNNRIFTIVESKENLGSAGGYALGMRAALKYSSCLFFWFLDDDNLPQQNALTALLLARSHLLSVNPEKHLALVSNRIDRPDFVNSVSVYKVNGKYPTPGAFLGFHLKHLIPAKKTNIYNSEYPALNVAPYGGLFLPRSIVETFEPIDTRLFICFDDFEYVLRLDKSGVDVRLVPSSKINDLDLSSIPSAATLMPSVASRTARNCSLSKAYYQIRNMIYINKRHGVKNNIDLFQYVLHKYIYVTIFYLISKLRGNKIAFDVFLKAVEDGEKEKFPTFDSGIH